MRKSGNKLFIRLFNGSNDEQPRNIRYGGPASKVELVQSNGQVIKEIAARHDGHGGTQFTLALPRLGIGTLRITP